MPPGSPLVCRQGVSQGASATFLGLVLQLPLSLRKRGGGEGGFLRAGRPSPSATLPLAHPRRCTCFAHFPSTHAEQFDNFPKLVGSRMSVEDIRARQSLWPDGRGQSGDRLWMMTDALAQWCLTEIEAGGILGTTGISSDAAGEATDQFVSLIEGLRDTGKLRNDDVTLLAIEL